MFRFSESSSVAIIMCSAEACSKRTHSRENTGRHALSMYYVALRFFSCWDVRVGGVLFLLPLDTRLWRGGGGVACVWGKIRTKARLVSSELTPHALKPSALRRHGAGSTNLMLSDRDVCEGTVTDWATGAP